MSNAALLSAFENVFKDLEKIDCLPEWSNGTGYFDGATQAKTPEFCFNKNRGVFGFTDKYGRRGIVFSLQPGCNAVLFERYKLNAAQDNFILVSNLPPAKRSVCQYLLEDDRIQSGCVSAFYKAVGLNSSGYDDGEGITASEVYRLIKGSK